MHVCIFHCGRGTSALCTPRVRTGDGRAVWKSGTGSKSGRRVVYAPNSQTPAGRERGHKMQHKRCVGRLVVFKHVCLFQGNGKYQAVLGCGIRRGAVYHQLLCRHHVSISRRKMHGCLQLATHQHVIVSRQPPCRSDLAAQCCGEMEHAKYNLLHKRMGFV